MNQVPDVLAISFMNVFSFGQYNINTFLLDPAGRPGSAVGIATAYGLDGPGIEFRWDEIFRTSPDRP